jgi:hypothetical protein
MAFAHLAPGALIDGAVDAELAAEWRRAQAERFQPTD